MKFTWGPKRAKRNLLKHGVSFESGSEVFSDPYAIFREDYTDESGEMRFQVIGRTQSQTLLLVASRIGRTRISTCITSLQCERL